MEKNVGGKDKYARILIGALTGVFSLGILSGILNYPELYSLVLGIVSLSFLANAFTGKCGINKALGVNTCKAE